MSNLFKQEMWLGDQFFIHFNKLPFNTAYKEIQTKDKFISYKY